MMSLLFTSFSTATPPQPLVEAFTTGAKLADGCRHVFLDVGSNRGVHVRMLMQPHLFPEAPFLRKWKFFDQYFGPSYATDATICSFGFEPNPAHAARLQKLGLQLRAMGRRAEWFSSAASYNLLARTTNLSVP